jgi:uncharacterized protein
MELMHLSETQWILAVFCGVLIGFSKTGIGGVSILMVPIMAGIFGGRISSGIVLPMLIFGDLIAVKRYNRHAEWHHVLKLLPWAFAGLFIGIAAGSFIDDRQFKGVIAVTVLLGIAVMVWQEKSGAEVPTHWAFAAVVGLVGGFSTMIGNAAGTVMAVYLLAMRFPKLSYIGTGAWFFMIINITKVPLQIFFWKGITPSTLLFNVMMIPAILVGTAIGIILIKRIPEKPFRYTIIVLTVIAAIRLFF